MLCLLAGISKERGIEYYKIFKRSVNKEKFAEYLTNLQAVNGNDNVAIYMDNLRVHTCDETKAKMRELSF